MFEEKIFIKKLLIKVNTGTGSVWLASQSLLSFEPSKYAIDLKRWEWLPSNKGRAPVEIINNKEKQIKVELLNLKFIFLLTRCINKPWIKRKYYF